VKWAEYQSVLRDRAAKRYGAGDVAVKLYAEPNTYAARPADGQPFQIEGYATTDAVDLEKEVILPEGIDTVSYFAQNRTMFVDHEYDILSAVGKCRNLKITPRGIICQSVLVNAPGNLKRDWVEALATQYQIGYSVVVQRIEKGKPTADEGKKYPGAEIITRRSKLIEISYTAIPMNGECQAFGIAPDGAKAVQSSVARKKIVFIG